jgi:hypothetical protein
MDDLRSPLCGDRKNSLNGDRVIHQMGMVRSQYLNHGVTRVASGNAPYKSSDRYTRSAIAIQDRRSHFIIKMPHQTGVLYQWIPINVAMDRQSHRERLDKLKQAHHFLGILAYFDSN